MLGLYHSYETSTIRHGLCTVSAPSPTFEFTEFQMRVPHFPRLEREWQAADDVQNGRRQGDWTDMMTEVSQNSRVGGICRR